MTISRYLDIVMRMNVVNNFKALADETRLRLVNIFLHYELNVNEIVEIMKMGQSRISRHLKILMNSALLTSRRDGMWTFYSAAGEGEGRRFIESVKYLFEDEIVFQDDLTTAKQILEARSREMARFFDSIAGDWEKLKREIIGDVAINDLILKHIPPGGTIVDLGCGTGDLSAVLKEKVERVIGVEKSPQMLDEARRRFSRDGENIDLRIGELEHLPLRDGEAGAAVVNMVLHHLPDPLKSFQEVHRVLETKGLFIIADLLVHNVEGMRTRYGDRWLGFAPGDIEKWLDTAGFVFKKIEYFDLKKGLKGFIMQSFKK